MLHQFWCLALTVIAGTVIAGAGVAMADSQEAPPAAETPLTNQEQAFCEQMSGCVLVGTFSVDGRNDKPPRPERYAISRVSKVKDNNWIFEAHIKYGDVDLPLPVPVQIDWAGDTPILSITNQKIPGLGEGFTSRVMFYDGRYAGTWQHGPVGGHMWGMIEKGDAPAADPAATPPNPER